MGRTSFKSVGNAIDGPVSGAYGSLHILTGPLSTTTANMEFIWVPSTNVRLHSISFGSAATLSAGTAPLTIGTAAGGTQVLGSTACASAGVTSVIYSGFTLRNLVGGTSYFIRIAANGATTTSGVSLSITFVRTSHIQADPRND